MSDINTSQSGAESTQVSKCSVCKETRCPVHPENEANLDGMMVLGSHDTGFGDLFSSMLEGAGDPEYDIPEFGFIPDDPTFTPFPGFSGSSVINEILSALQSINQHNTEYDIVMPSIDFDVQAKIGISGSVQSIHSRDKIGELSDLMNQEIHEVMQGAITQITDKYRNKFERALGQDTSEYNKQRIAEFARYQDLDNPNLTVTPRFREAVQIHRERHLKRSLKEATEISDSFNSKVA